LVGKKTCNALRNRVKCQSLKFRNSFECCFTRISCIWDAYLLYILQITPGRPMILGKGVVD